MKHKILLFALLLLAFGAHGQEWSLGIRTGLGISLNRAKGLNARVPNYLDLRLESWRYLRQGQLGAEAGLYAYRPLKGKWGLHLEGSFERRTFKAARFPDDLKSMYVSVRYGMVNLRTMGTYSIGTTGLRAQAGASYAYSAWGGGYVFYRSSPTAVGVDYNDWKSERMKRFERRSLLFAEVGVWYETKHRLSMGLRYSHGLLRSNKEKEPQVPSYQRKLGSVSVFVAVKFKKFEEQ